MNWDIRWSHTHCTNNWLLPPPGHTLCKPVGRNPWACQGQWDSGSHSQHSHVGCHPWGCYYWAGHARYPWEEESLGCHTSVGRDTQSGWWRSVQHCHMTRWLDIYVRFINEMLLQSWGSPTVLFVLKYVGPMCCVFLSLWFVVLIFSSCYPKNWL